MDNKTNCIKKGGKKPHAYPLPMMVLVLFGMIALVGVAAADNFYPGMPPVTKLSSAINGTVNGDVDVIMAKDPWNPNASVTYNQNAQYNWGNLTLAVRPDLVDLKFARLYVVVYGGNLTAPGTAYNGNVSVGMYQENMTGYNDYLGTLAEGKVLALDPCTCDPNPEFPLVNMSRVTSDYLLVFDVKDYLKDLNTNKINVNTTSYNVTGVFDGRIKEVKLVYGWNWTESDLDYWVNEGHDVMSTKGTPGVYNETWFNGTGVDEATQYNATLWVDYIASKDGKYKWNGNYLNPIPTVLYQGKYGGLNRLIWNEDIAPYMTADNNLSYTNVTGTTYKIPVAVLKLKKL
jgi:hypothetical protein